MADKKLGDIRTGEVPCSRSPILGDEDDLPFWVDDRVRPKAPGSIDARLGTLPGYPPGVRLVREIVRLAGEEPTYMLSDALCGGWQDASDAADIELVDRGNVWRLMRGEPTVFHGWQEELDCRLLLGQAERIHHPGGRTVRWQKEEAKAFIANGAADAYAAFYPDRPPVNMPDYRLYRFEDRETGRRIAATVLADPAALINR